MDVNESTEHTHSEEWISYKYARKTAVHLTIRSRIEEFESLTESYRSEGVSSELAPDADWKLGVEPNTRGSTELCICLSGGITDELLEANFHLYLIGGDCNIDSISRDTYKFGDEEAFTVGPYREEVSHDRVRRALQADGSLVVAAEIEFLIPGENSLPSYEDLPNYEDQQRWVAKLSGFCGDKATSDCCIKIGGETLLAHKLPLMACSRVLHEKFTDPTTEESKRSVVNVTDSKEPEAMRALIQYCYRGYPDAQTLDGRWSEEIFKLADCYAFDDLKALIEKRRLEKKPRVESVIPPMGTESVEESYYKYVRMTVVHLTIKLRIDKCWYPDESYSSKGVSSELAPRAIWKLEVKPGEISGCSRVSLSLTGPMADNFETLEANFHLYLINGDGKIDTIERGTWEFNCGENGPYIGYNTSPYESLNDYFDDKLYMEEISYDRVWKAEPADNSLMVAADFDFLAPDDSALPGYEAQQRWAAKLSEICGDPTTADCWIKIGGETLPAHKLPLMAWSTAFRTMFTNSEESKRGVVEIEDFEHPEPMRAIIHYCCHGYLNAETMDQEWSEEVFKLACKYFMDDLKALLERHFVDEALCVENVVDLAIFADTYFAGELKAACVDLIAREGKTVFESDEWKELKETRPGLAIDLAEAACLRKG